MTMEKMHANDLNRKAMFSNVYSNAIWAHGDASVPLSGSGSTVQKTENARHAIKTVVVKYGIRSIIDAPCGDLTWMKTLFPFFQRNNVSYTGVDIVGSQIEKHRKQKHANHVICVDLPH